MDFFAHQDRAKASTFKLLVLYALAVVGVVVSLNLVALLLTNVNRKSELLNDGTVVKAPIHIVPEAQLLTTIGALAVIGLAGLYRKATIGSDGANVAEMLGGQLVDPATRDPEERKLMNIVDEMSIASGVPKPRVYIMNNEEGINAFAAGTRLDNAVVAVTRGCIHTLNRDELQGVVAHEFSHILNGDMRLNLRMIALNFGIMAIGVIGYYILRTSPRFSGGKKEGAAAMAAIAIIGIGMTIIGFVGMFFGRILQASVSRQREFLADASAVQFTRNPSGIANALKKIGGLSSKIHDSNASECAHMFFAPGISSLFATHPPIEQRIRAIEPNWDGKLIVDEARRPGLGQNVGTPASAFDGGLEPNVAGFNQVLPPPQTRIPVNADNVVEAAGITRPPAIHHADAVIAQLPEHLHQAARDPYTARALVLALLVDADPNQRQVQLMELSGKRSALARETIEMSNHIESLDRTLRLPLLDLSIPALQTLTPGQLDEMQKLAAMLSAVDRKLSLFELALMKIIEHVWQSRSPIPAPIRFRMLTEIAEPVRTLFSALARASDSPAWQNAYARGMDRLGLTRAEPTNPKTVDVARAIDTLREASPQIKKKIIDAAAHLVVEDNTVTISEAELLRATSAALDVPLPPIYER